MDTHTHAQLGFWNRVEEHRLMAGMTRAQLAQAAGVQADTLGRWACRSYMPKADVALAIARALGVGLEYLVDGTWQRQCQPDWAGDCDAQPGLGCVQIPYYQTPGDVVRPSGSPGTGELGNVRSAAMPLQMAGDGTDIGSIRCIDAVGDAMEGSGIQEQDMVFFRLSQSCGNGLYAVRFPESIQVRRVEFTMDCNTVRLLCDNRMYMPCFASRQDVQSAVLGKVIGWIHACR